MIAYEPSPVPPLTDGRSRRRRTMFAVTSLLVVVLGGGLVMNGLPMLQNSSKAAVEVQPPPATPVSVAQISQRDTTLWTDFSGRLEAVNRVEVRPRAAGAVVAVRFREGAMVKQGDLLFVIDPAPYLAEVQRLEAQVLTAQARLELAIVEQARAQRLVPTAAVPQRELDQRINDFRAAGAAVQAAQAQLTEARLNLGYTEVRAPIDGRIGRIEVTPGNLVPAGPTAPILTTLVSVDPIYASFEADERTVTSALASLPPGSDISRIPVEVGTLGMVGTPVRGTLQFVDNVVDARSGTMRVRARFDNADGLLRPGQFARVRLGQPEPAATIAIDERALGTDQDRRYVMVVGTDNHAVYRQVTLGGVSDGLRIITAGLKPGERIVVDGLQRIQPGALVSPRPVAMEAARNTATTTQ